MSNYEIRLSWPEMNLPADEEDRSEVNEWMNDPLKRNIIIGTYIVKSMLDLALLAVFTIASMALVLSLTAIEVSSEIGLLWMMTAIGTLIICVDIISGNTVSKISSKLTYFAFIAIAIVYFMLKGNNGTHKPDVGSELFTRVIEWAQFLPFMFDEKNRKRIT